MYKCPLGDGDGDGNIPADDDEPSCSCSPPTNALVEALEQLSCHPYVLEWAPEKSVFKLLYILCLPELDQVLGTIESLLSSKVNDNIVDKICLKYVIRKGQVAQVAALLLFAAWDSMEPYIRTWPSSININIFEVLYSVRDVFHAHRRSRRFGNAKHLPKFVVPFEVARYIWRKSLDDPKLIITPQDIFSDDIPCLLIPRLNPEEKDALEEALRLIMPHGSSSLKALFRRMPKDGLERVDDYKSLDEEINSLCEEDYENLLTKCIEDDYSDGFVEFFNNPKYKNPKEHFKRFLGKLVVEQEAENCLLAIIDGKMDKGLTLEYTAPVDAPYGWTPLHEAARCRCSNIIAVLLERGFADVANNKVNWSDLNLVQAVPLDVALSQARSHCINRGGKSAVGLIVALYQSFMSSVLEAVELLAPETNDILQKFDRYKMDGKIVEVGLLLMAAHKQLLASSHLDGGSETTADLYSLPSENVTISSEIGNQCQPQWKGTLREKREMKVLLNIFDKVGDKLRAYLRLGGRIEDIAAILEDAGSSVPHKDAYICLVSRRYVNFKGFQQFLTREEDIDDLPSSL